MTPISNPVHFEEQGCLSSVAEEGEKEVGDGRMGRRGWGCGVREAWGWRMGRGRGVGEGSGREVGDGSGAEGGGRIESRAKGNKEVEGGNIVGRGNRGWN